MTLASEGLKHQILKLIENDYNHTKHEPLYSYLSDEVGWPWKNLYENGSVTIPGVGTLKVVEILPSNDESSVVIFTVDDTGLLFSKTGWRDSWLGYTHDDGPLVEVERYEKVSIAYREKK